MRVCDAAKALRRIGTAEALAALREHGFETGDDVWYPSRVGASPEQCANVEWGYAGIHRPDPDEALSVNGMLRGEHPPRRRVQQIEAG